MDGSLVFGKSFCSLQTEDIRQNARQAWRLALREDEVDPQRTSKPTHRAETSER
jgi:hypothetical protein